MYAQITVLAGENQAGYSSAYGPVNGRALTDPFEGCIKRPMKLMLILCFLTAKGTKNTKKRKSQGHLL